jgi:hypothetical protein
MDAGTSATCGSCGARVVWGLTAKGKSCPMDPDTGLSHYTTCDDPERWSKTKKDAGLLPGQLTLFPSEGDKS